MVKRVGEPVYYNLTAGIHISLINQMNLLTTVFQRDVKLMAIGRYKRLCYFTGSGTCHMLGHPTLFEQAHLRAVSFSEFESCFDRRRWQSKNRMNEKLNDTIIEQG